MKKLFYTSFVFLFAFLLVGCGSSSSKDDVTKHNKNNNYVECTGEEDGSTGKLVVYLDKDDKATSFDYYLTVNAPDVTEDQVKSTEELVCNGQGEFKKEWIEECSYKLDGEKVKAHVYVNSSEWLGTFGTKDKLLEGNFADTDLDGLKCVSK